MKTRRLVLFLLGLLVVLVAAAGVFLWSTAPRLVEHEPGSGANQVPTGAPLRLTFSRWMEADSVTSRFSTDPARSGEFTWEGNTLTFTPDRPWPSHRVVTVSLEAGARASSTLSLPMRQAGSWSFTTGGTLLAYLWPADGAADLYTLDPLSGDVDRLTEAGGVLDFSVSGDGASLYFSARNPAGGSDLYRLDRLQGAEAVGGSAGGPQLVLACPQSACLSPRVSPDGKFLAFERISISEDGRPDPSQIWLFSLPDGEAIQVGHPEHETLQPAWSSHGLLAYYDMGQQAYVIYNPGDQGRVYLPNQTGELGSWRPDGSAYLAPEIFFKTSEVLETTASSHLMLFDVLTGRPVDLTLADDLEDAAPVFSPDGASIAFARKYLDPSRWTPGRQLWLMHADGGDARQLTDIPAYNHYDFAWSPDGRQLAYVRFNQTTLYEQPEVWLLDVAGGEPLQLVIGGYAPQWIP